MNQCPAGTIFVEGENCVPGDPDTCLRGIPEPTVPTFPTEDTTTLEIRPTDPPIDLDRICEGITQVVVVPDPFSCTQFILCIFGNVNIVPCQPEAPVFDPITLVCVPGIYRHLRKISFSKKVSFDV